MLASPHLKDHPRAKIETALKAVPEKTEKLNIGNWLKVYATERILTL